jgi:hypothetical protein
MKPKFDLNAPVVGALVTGYGERAMRAYDAAQSLNSAVRPIYAVRSASNRPEQIGSCVLLEIQEHTFALSASHVFDPIGEHVVLIAGGTRLHQLAGERFSSLRGPSGTHRDDPVDASVLHITSDVPDEIRKASLNIGDLDGFTIRNMNDFHVASGYRISRSKVSPTRTLMSELDAYPTIEVDDSLYGPAGLDRTRQVALAFEDHVLQENRWQTAPGVRGLSGGAIVRISGLPSDLRLPAGPSQVAKLTAITIARRPDRGDQLGLLIGTRISVHLGLIARHHPNLLPHSSPLRVV